MNRANKHRFRFPAALIGVLMILLGWGEIDPLPGTEQYARQTNAECGQCHVASGGGGVLTGAGEAYRRFIEGISGPERQYEGAGVGKRLLKFSAGFVHLATAVFWFGTILYVHLVLKPGYASGGLPRGEVRVGLFSMLIMAVSGGILTFFRISSPAELIHTRFGILLTVKVMIFAAMVLSALLVVFWIGPRLRRRRAGLQVEGATQHSAEGGDMNLEELAACDGREGRNAYVAYKGVIYDVSRSGLWRQGNHVKRHQAGTDLTEILSQAPHGEEKIFAMPEVGQLLRTSTPKGALPQRFFYAMAYFNLFNVVAILFILALWRWW